MSLQPQPGAAAPTRREWLATVTLAVALTLALTWPLLARLRIMDPGDSAFFAWVMAWERHALASDPTSLPHANVYHPARYVLGLDEPILGTTLLGMPLWPFTDDAVLIYSLVRLLTYVLSLLSAWRLARELGCGQPAALLAGALFAFSPIRTDQLAHLSTLGTQWLPCVALGLVRFARHGRVRDALLAGACYALAFYACGYHGLLGVLVWPAFALVLLWGRFGLWTRALPALGLALLMLWPLWALHEAAFAPQAFLRAGDETERYSAQLTSFLSVSSWNHPWGELLSGFRSAANNLFPGLLPIALTLCAAVALARAQRRPSRETLAFAALALFGALVALGPELRVGSAVFASPVAWVRELLPPLGRIRAFGRAGIFLALGSSILAGRAVAALRLRPPAVAALGLVGLLEGLVAPIPLASWAQVVDSSRPPPPVYAWLARQPAGQVLVELPLLSGDSLTRRPAFHESIYALRSTHHWQRLVNGYVGVETRTYAELRERLRTFPDENSLAALRGVGVRYALVHREGYGPNQIARLEPALAASSSLRCVADFGADRVYELGSGLVLPYGNTRPDPLQRSKVRRFSGTTGARNVGAKRNSSPRCPKERRR